MRGTLRRRRNFSMSDGDQHVRLIISNSKVGFTTEVLIFFQSNLHDFTKCRVINFVILKKNLARRISRISGIPGAGISAIYGDFFFGVCTSVMFVC